MLVPELRRAQAQFQRYGPLAYRLAYAILANDAAVADALAAAFSSFAGNRGQWPALHVILTAVHRECLGRRDRSGAAKPQLRPVLSRDEESSAVPASTLISAFESLREEEQSLLWNALLGRAEENDLDDLAAALRRLEVAAGNEGIPDEEEPEWTE